MSTEKCLLRSPLILQFKHQNIEMISKNKCSLSWCVLNRSGFLNFTEWLLLWCFQIVFWMIWVWRTGVYLTFISRKQRDNLTSEVTWQIWEKRVYFYRIQDSGGRWVERFPYQLFLVTSTKVRISSWNFLTFSFNPFATLV